MADPETVLLTIALVPVIGIWLLVAYILITSK